MSPTGPDCVSRRPVLGALAATAALLGVSRASSALEGAVTAIDIALEPDGTMLQRAKDAGKVEDMRPSSAGTVPRVPARSRRTTMRSVKISKPLSSAACALSWPIPSNS